MIGCITAIIVNEPETDTVCYFKNYCPEYLKMEGSKRAGMNLTVNLETKMNGKSTAKPLMFFGDMTMLL